MKFVWKERRGAENFRKFEKLSEVLSGGQVVAGRKIRGWLPRNYFEK